MRRKTQTLAMEIANARDWNRNGLRWKSQRLAMGIAKACDGNRSLRRQVATRDETRDVTAMEIAGCDTNRMW